MQYRFVRNFEDQKKKKIRSYTSIQSVYCLICRWHFKMTDESIHCLLFIISFLFQNKYYFVIVVTRFERIAHTHDVYDVKRIGFPQAHRVQTIFNA